MGLFIRDIEVLGVISIVEVFYLFEDLFQKVMGKKFDSGYNVFFGKWEINRNFIQV